MSESVIQRVEDEEKTAGKKPEVVQASSASQMDGTVAETKSPSSYSKLSVVSMVLFSGLAIGSDGYNSSVIGNLALVFGALYPDSYSRMSSRLSTAFIVGMIIGMLGFGYTTDRLGRKSGAVLTTAILVTGLVLSSASSGRDEMGMFWMMAISRGIAGVGAGGEYPVSGAGAAEATDESAGARKSRGFIFAIIGDISATMGFIFGGVVPLLLVLCVHQEQAHYNIVWRCAFALGLIPPLSIFWFRYKMAVSTAYRKSAAKKQRIPPMPILKRYWRSILGCSIGWFMYNFISYPFGLFASSIMSAVNADSSIVANLGWGVVINCFYIPGGLIGGLLSDRIGRRRTLTLGFALQSILGFIVGGALGKIETVLPLFIVLYGLFLTLGEVGPGATILILSSEPFPTSIRGQCVGLISAVGKAGAAIGTAVFTPIVSSFGDDTYRGNQATFLIGSGFALLGAISSWFLIPDLSNRLDNEDEAWKAYLQDQGYEIEWGDHETRDPESVKMDAVRS